MFVSLVSVEYAEKQCYMPYFFSVVVYGLSILSLIPWLLKNSQEIQLAWESMKEDWGWWEAVGCYQLSLLFKNFPLQMHNCFILLPCCSDMLRDVSLPWQLPLTGPRSSCWIFLLYRQPPPFSDSAGFLKVCVKYMSSFKRQKIPVLNVG